LGNRADWGHKERTDIDTRGSGYVHVGVENVRP
jgi:hypothetical protein